MSIQSRAFERHLAAEANAPRCHKCNRTTSEIELTWCDESRCDNSFCSECVTELQLELEACSEACASKIAASLRKRFADQRTELYKAKGEIRDLRAAARSILIRRAA